MVKKSDGKQTELITWGPLTALIVLLASYILAQVFAALILSLYPLFRRWTAVHASQWLANSTIAQFWLTILVELILLLLIYYFLKRRRSSFKSIGLKGRLGFRDLGFVTVGFGMYFAVFFVISKLIRLFAPHLNTSVKQQLGFSTNISGVQLWLVFVSLVLLPPIVEEIMFRGFLYSGLKTKLNKIWAALITSVIFASLHLIEGVGGLLWIGGVDTFILSMVLVYLREKTGKLYASIGLHMIKNAIAFVGVFIYHLS